LKMDGWSNHHKFQIMNNLLIRNNYIKTKRVLSNEFFFLLVKFYDLLNFDLPCVFIK
jgi:hypothetical protein